MLERRRSLEIGPRSRCRSGRRRRFANSSPGGARRKKDPASLTAEEPGEGCEDEGASEATLAEEPGESGPSDGAAEAMEKRRPSSSAREDAIELRLPSLSTVRLVDAGDRTNSRCSGEHEDLSSSSSTPRLLFFFVVPRTFLSGA
jgi:hypothetical protein